MCVFNEAFEQYSGWWRNSKELLFKIFVVILLPRSPLKIDF